jgi:hypothetical protein
MEANLEAITNYSITNLQGPKLWAGAGTGTAGTGTVGTGTAGTGTHYRLGCSGFESWWIQKFFPFHTCPE